MKNAERWPRGSTSQRPFWIGVPTHCAQPLVEGGGPPPSRPRRVAGLVSSGPDKPALAVHAGGIASVVNINDVLAGHVSLEVECVDRLYINAYCPLLQVGGQVVRFLTGHLGHPVPSPTLFRKIGNRFRCEVDRFAASAGVPVLHLKKPDRSRWDDRKLDHVRPHLDRAAREQHFGVVAIVVAQEFQRVTGARNRSRTHFFPSVARPAGPAEATNSTGHLLRRRGLPDGKR